MKKLTFILSTVLLLFIIGCENRDSENYDSFTVGLAEIDPIATQLLNSLAPRTNLFYIDLSSEGAFEIELHLNIYEYGELINTQSIATFFAEGEIENIYLFLSLPFDDYENIAILLLDIEDSQSTARSTLSFDFPAFDDEAMTAWNELSDSITATIGNEITLVHHVIHHGDSISLHVDGSVQTEYTTTITATVTVDRMD